MPKRPMSHLRGARLLGAVVLMLLVATVTTAQPGVLQIAWWTVDSGGGTSSGGGLTLSGTSGQSDAGVLQSADGTLRLEGGFWAGAAPDSRTMLFLPMIGR